ncbi:hypothetical protein WR25_07985 [Diploscapter pachys]|uniref:histidine kinase n=1 Tax=Diploscapter pachys TaxID=2018661 RepID=A0A2A2JZZ1_9BILA|nr:hypothetical protein WR25_07985 [Diploscapter pachys]
MSLPVHEQNRQALYQAFDEALSKAGRHRVGHPYESKLAFQVWDDQATLLVHTPSAPAFAVPPSTPGFSDMLVQGQRWRGFVLPVPEKHWLIWVGERNDVRYDLIDRIVRHTLMPFLLGSLALALLVWAAIGWGLQPLQNMARIEQLLRREHRFIADAAHEMRTPLAILRLHAQNAQAATGEAERDKALGYLIGGVDRLTRVVNQLLTLARLEPRLAQRNWAAIDLGVLATETLAELTPWILERGQEPSLEIAEGVDYRVFSDAGALAIALQNLVTNAVDHSPPGGRVRRRPRYRVGGP